MKPFTLPLTVVAALLVPMIPCIAGTREGQARTREEAPEQKQRYLLLSNDAVSVVQSVELQNDSYKVVRTGATLYYDVDRVRFVGDSVEDIYEFKRAQIPDHDTAEHLKLGKWCLTHGLRDLAIEEFLLVKSLDPSNREVESKLFLMQQSKESSPSASADQAEDRVVFQRVADPSVVIENFVRGNGQDVFKQYNRAEMVLTAKCAGCHGNRRHEGEFRLFATKASELRQRLTARNLESVMEQVNLKAPQASTLLTMALSQHGNMAVPALGGINDPMYRDIEDFVYLVAARYNRDDTMITALKQNRLPTQPNAFGAARPTRADLLTQVEMRPRPTATVPGDDVSRPGLGSIAADDSPEPGTEAMPRQQVTKPQVVEDPFDPNSFNQQFGATPPKAKEEVKESPKKED